MGPFQHDTENAGAQAPPCRPRARECLLKGCGRWFTPRCARSCYCSEACRRAARRWSQQKAQARYRRSEQGRACRREQCRRWRARQRAAPRRAAKKCSRHKASTACEGHQIGPNGKKILCDRPGCFNTFIRSSRSPRQRFCCSLCRRALRRAWLRERRWRKHCNHCPLARTVLCLILPRGP